MSMYASLTPPAGRMPIEGPKPFYVAYPYGPPGDSFRRLAVPGKATCVAYHKGVDPRQLAGVRRGNEYRYGPGDPRFEEMVADMRANGFRGGNGQRIIVHVSEDDCWIAEGNHRLLAAEAAALDALEVEIRYLCRADEEFMLIPFEYGDPGIRFVVD